MVEKSTKSLATGHWLSLYTNMAGSLKVFLEGSGVPNRYEYSFYFDDPPPGPLLYCTQEQYSSLMNPPEGYHTWKNHQPLLVDFTNTVD
jgi:hypothetical protein